LDPGGHLHTEDHCPGDFKSQNRPKFRSVTNEDNGNVPSGKCAIQSAYDDSYLKIGGDKLERGDKDDLVEEDYKFVVNDVGNGKVNIFSVGKNKYVKLAGHDAKANSNSDCGNDCRFTIEGLSESGIIEN
jgi:hypothetical protein